jgi:hypothetical protein
MVDCLLLAIALIPVKVKGKPCYRLGKNPDAGIHSCHLHGCPLSDGFSGNTGAEIKPPRGTGQTVLCASIAHSTEDAHWNNLLPGTSSPSPIMWGEAMIACAYCFFCSQAGKPNVDVE